MSAPSVTSAVTLSNSFLTETIQVCIVTRDYQRVMEGMVRAGIGPWRVYTFGPDNCADLTLYGQPASFSMKLCMAWTGAMFWEIVQPLDGHSIYKDFLDKHGEGIHHTAFACGDLSWDERVKQFEDRGFACIQSGRWMNQVPWAYFATEDATTTTFEIFDIPADFVMPEPEAWYPAAPTG
ncbi:MAG: VOC family protein [Geminicoccaceae bacterium]